MSADIWLGLLLTASVFRLLLVLRYLRAREQRIHALVETLRCHCPLLERVRQTK